MSEKPAGVVAGADDRSRESWDDPTRGNGSILFRTSLAKSTWSAVVA